MADTQQAGMTLATTHLTPRIGVEIKADPDALLSGSYTPYLRQILDETGLILFRQINLDDRQQVAFARTLGQVVEQGQANIYKITLDPRENATADYLHGTFFWHIDGTVDDIPTRATLLTAHRLSDTGGETQWANTYAAYDDLPEADKEAFAGLRVVHTQETMQRLAQPDLTEADYLRYRRDRPAKSHPMVWTHQSGRKSLLLGSTASHIEGMSAEESRALLDRLMRWSTQPQYIYQHHWNIGDLVIWDNTGTMHRVTRYAKDSGRMMHRTTLVGEEAVA